MTLKITSPFLKKLHPSPGLHGKGFPQYLEMLIPKNNASWKHLTKQSYLFE